MNLTQLPAIDFTLTGWGFAAAALLGALWLLTLYRARIYGVGSAARRAVPDPTRTPEGASVVVTAGDDAPALNSLLHHLFEQEFDGPMEVIVVNDGKNEEIKDCVTLFKHAERRSNLYITFTPPEVRNVSHRKLAITLGIKAAHYPVVVLVDEHTSLPGNVWLKRMVRPFENPAIDLVIGSALPDPRADRHRGRRYRAFTFAADTVAYLSAALHHSPYRGHGFNLAYRRDLFFKANGFCAALNLMDGDDDIFVNRVARRDNVAVEISPAAQVKYGRPSSRSEYRIRRPRRMFCAGMLRRGTARFFGFSSLMLYVWLLGCLGAGAVAGLTSDWVMAAVAAVTFITVWITLAVVWRRTLRALHTRPMVLTVPVMLLRRPWSNLRHKLLARLRRPDYHTWVA